MSGNDELLSFVAELAAAFPHFTVVSSNEQETSPADVPIIGISAFKSDSEICIVRSAAGDTERIALELRTFYLSLKSELHMNPSYSLVVSEWFQIDEEHSGRADMPLRGVEVDEEAEVFRLLF